VTEWDHLRYATTPASEWGQTRGDDHAPRASDPVDWDRFQSLAATHQLVPRVVAGIDRIEGVPESVRADLVGRSRAHAQSSLQLTSALHSLLDGFDDAGIHALPYKGPVLSAAIHGDVSARQYVDIDILVPTADFERACETLRDSGYEAGQRLNALGEVAFTNEGGATVDLHHHVLPRYFPDELDFDDLWHRHESVDVGGRSVPALNPADRVVVLAVHGTKHRWYRLSWVHDLATLLADGRAPFEHVRERATALGCRRHVRLGYWLAREIFDVALPSEVADTLDTDPTVDALGNEAIEELREGTATPPSDSEQHSYQWRALDSWSDRLVYATRIATIPSEGDIESVQLPDSLAPLYRAVRPMRLVARGGRAGLRRLQS